MDSVLSSAIPPHPPPPTASAPSFGEEWRLLEPPQQLYRFAEADNCSYDTPRRRSIGPTRTKPRNSRLSAIAVGTPITGRPPQSGRIEARTGLRMMPTSPRSPLSFRTAGFPQYGWKDGISDGAFPRRRSA